jgi:hypothetical protein
MKSTSRPEIFKWRQTAPEVILCAVRWYLRYSLSLRDVEGLLTERGLAADHTTIWRWVQRYGPELEQRLRRHLKPTNKSWRVDERPTFACRVAGAICIGPSIRAAPQSIFCCRCRVTPARSHDILPFRSPSLNCRPFRGFQLAAVIFGGAHYEL